MDIISFNNEFATANLQFARIFTNINISRKKKNKQIVVPCVISSRSRILKNIENPKVTGKVALPIILISREGFTIDQTRVANLHLEKQLVSSNKDFNVNTLSPLPINIQYTVSIITKYPGDTDEILCNFLPFFNKDIYVRVANPKFENKKLKCEIVWDGNCIEERPPDLTPDADDIQITSTGFTYKTFLFGGTDTLDEYLRDLQIGNIQITDHDKVHNPLGKYWVTDTEMLIDAYANKDGYININDIPTTYPSDLLDRLAELANEDGLISVQELIKVYPNGIIGGNIGQSRFHAVDAAKDFDEYFEEFYKAKDKSIYSYDCIPLFIYPDELPTETEESTAE